MPQHIINQSINPLLYLHVPYLPYLSTLVTMNISLPVSIQIQPTECECERFRILGGTIIYMLALRTYYETNYHPSVRPCAYTYVHTLSRHAPYDFITPPSQTNLARPTPRTPEIAERENEKKDTP